MIDAVALSNCSPQSPLQVSEKEVDVIKKIDPFFYDFLVETGRLIIIRNNTIGQSRLG
jgi:hypothetical protein